MAVLQQQLSELTVDSNTEDNQDSVSSSGTPSRGTNTYWALSTVYCKSGPKNIILSSGLTIFGKMNAVLPYISVNWFLRLLAHSGFD